MGLKWGSQSLGLSLELGLLKFQAGPKPTSSPCLSQAWLGLGWAELSRLRAWGPAWHINTWLSSPWFLVLLLAPSCLVCFSQVPFSLAHTLTSSCQRCEMLRNWGRVRTRNMRRAGMGCNEVCLCLFLPLPLSQCIFSPPYSCTYVVFTMGTYLKPMVFLKWVTWVWVWYWILAHCNTLCACATVSQVFTGILVR